MSERASIGDLLDRFEHVMVQHALESAATFGHTKRRLIYALLNPRLLRLPPRYSIQWLTGLWYDCLFLESLGVKKAPFGWKWDRCPSRDITRLVPVWILYPLRAWEYRWYVYQFLIRAGFLVGPEGGYYVDFRWSWRFWRSERVTGQYAPRKEWFRFAVLCWRIERAYYRDVPQWT